MKHVRDYFEVNVIPCSAFAALTLADLQALTAITVGLVSIVCSIVITRAKLKKGD